METYARLHGVTARGRSRTTSHSPIRVPEEGKFLQPDTDDFITEALARLDQQVNSLSAQVLSAVRAVSTMQEELMQSVVARVRTLESGGSKSSEHMLALHSDSVRNVPPSTSVVQSVDERLRGRFLELQAWQADVEEAISQLVREASREPNRHIKRAVAIEAKVVDINVVDSDGVSALRFAAQYGHYDITKYLLDNGANPNLRAKDQIDPLLSAVDYGHVEIVELLVGRGANVLTKTKETNAVLLAREKGRGEIEKLLLKAGATDDMGLWFNIRKRVSKTFRIKG